MGTDGPALITMHRNLIDPDHFTVFDLREGWEKKLAKYNSLESIDAFKKRQELLKTTPLSIRLRTKRDKSYREGWVDSAAWIQKAMHRIFHEQDYSNNA